jgi:hypothetical protein
VDLAEHLLALELELLTNATRKDPARLSELLTHDFREFGSSGRVFSKKEITLALQQELPVSLSIANFEMRLLADGVALVTYQSVKEQGDGPPATALRSSIWIRTASDWKMIFHQGTKIPPAA